MDEKKNAEETLDGVKSEAEGAADKAGDVAETAADKAEDAKDAATEKAEDLAKDTAQNTADTAEAATAVEEKKAKAEKPVAKISPEYEKIVWPTAGRVWSNTLTVIIIAALMAGTIFLVDLGLRAIIDGFMSI